MQFLNTTYLYTKIMVKKKRATITNTVKIKNKNKENDGERERIVWDKLIVYHTSVCVNGCEERKESERVFDAPIMNLQ